MISLNIFLKTLRKRVRWAATQIRTNFIMLPMPKERTYVAVIETTTEIICIYINDHLFNLIISSIRNYIDDPTIKKIIE